MLTSKHRDCNCKGKYNKTQHNHANLPCVSNESVMVVMVRFYAGVGLRVQPSTAQKTKHNNQPEKYDFPIGSSSPLVPATRRRQHRVAEERFAGGGAAKEEVVAEAADGRIGGAAIEEVVPAMKAIDGSAGDAMRCGDCGIGWRKEIHLRDSADGISTIHN